MTLTHCFLGKVDLVKDVIERLHVFLQSRNNGSEAVAWKAVDFDSYLEQAHDVKSVSVVIIGCTTWIDHDITECTSWKNRNSSLLVTLQPNAD